jgi:hypothetical protein
MSSEDAPATRLRGWAVAVFGLLVAALVATEKLLPRERVATAAVVAALLALAVLEALA